MSDKTTAVEPETTPTQEVKTEDKSTQEQAEKEEKMLSQTEVNGIVQGIKAKYSDYDDMKKKLAEIEDANKTDLEKLTERATNAETKLAEYEKEKQESAWRKEVRLKFEIPENMDALLTGESLEDIEAKGKLLAENISKNSKPVIKGDTGTVTNPQGDSDLKQFLKDNLGGN